MTSILCKVLSLDDRVCSGTTGESLEDTIWAAHLPHHLGMDRTLPCSTDINLTSQHVRRKLAGCEAC